MRVTGIICEYNPFHNGHAWQLARARALYPGRILCYNEQSKAGGFA